MPNWGYNGMGYSHEDQLILDEYMSLCSQVHNKIKWHHCYDCSMESSENYIGWRCIQLLPIMHYLKV